MASQKRDGRLIEAKAENFCNGRWFRSDVYIIEEFKDKVWIPFMSRSMKFAATGDAIVTRARLQSEAPTNLQAVIAVADARLTNLEIVAASRNAFASAESGGTWMKASRKAIRAMIQHFGFNLVSWANNHAMDYSYRGLEETAELLNEMGVVHAGVGADLRQASRPRYLDSSNGRVALIAATSTFFESHRAGPAGAEIVGRPGVNPLRYNTVYGLEQNQMESLREIAEISKVNFEREWFANQGFGTKSAPEILPFGPLNFTASPKPGPRTTPNPEDLNRIIASVCEARRQADYVVVSLHSHELQWNDPCGPAEFLVDAAHAMIEAGAHVVVCHGSHELRGIEIYRQKPIFYSLGNFMFEYFSIDEFPQEFYDFLDLPVGSSPAEALDKRTAMETKGFTKIPGVWRSFVPVCDFSGEDLTKILIYPIDLGRDKPRARRGTPSLGDTDAIRTELTDLSAALGTKIRWSTSCGAVDLSSIP
ncbi:CapA family protein [Mesorhizobium sp. M0923]|uniref:CapA family protein n=1 Tax=unclassified Mesorhizobium TaxID=325217 RepID=UPI0003D00459|nr:CapA family protein [Mesorhizobium sp. L48C026A00]ESZ05484.1 hypothetical protein X737_35810 [Mesorhizobium sp. L48C026A00]